MNFTLKVLRNKQVARRPNKWQGDRTSVKATEQVCKLVGQNQIYQPTTARPDHEQQHCYHHAPTVKPEAATAVVELLMMGVRTPRNMLSCT